MRDVIEPSRDLGHIDRALAKGRDDGGEKDSRGQGQEEQGEAGEKGQTGQTGERQADSGPSGQGICEDCQS